MKKKLISLFCGLFFIGILFPLTVGALDAPAMNGPVNDLAGVMSTTEKDELTAYLSAVNTQTGVQLAVLTVPSLEGDSIENFSMHVAEKWKLGSKDTDNGVVLVVSIAERALRIEVGYGLEGELTDMKSGLIIRNVIVPSFKNGNYGEGIIAGAQNIVGIATGNASIVAQDVQNPPEETANSGSGIVGFVFMVFFIILMISGAGRRGGLGGLLGGLLLGSMLGGSFGGGGASGGW